MESKLETSRRDLLDLTARNRLINTPRSQKRSSRLDIVGESTAEIFQKLVADKKQMSFLSGSVETNDLNQQNIFELDSRVNDQSTRQPTQLKLQTDLKSEPLQKKLLKLYYDARTLEEEQGVNTLYLACGFLKWFESDSSDKERQAPLILIPVKLDRKSANAKFHLSWDENEITTNLSIKEKLKVEFQINIPEISESEDFSPDSYLDEVAGIIKGRNRWEVIRNGTVLWFFSFSKFLMYKDLDPSAWPETNPITGNENIRSMLGEGFGSDAPICGENDNVDEHISPTDSIHIMDADSSQAIAIEEVKQGRSLVIQGPPGTGKSQTIANLIASAVRDGKKVLFVAEKMAALQVVKRRMENVGLGSTCLELHSNKANKKAVLDDLDQTLKLGSPVTTGVAENSENLLEVRDKLNRYCQLLHTSLGAGQFSTYQAIGELVRLQREGATPEVEQLEDSVNWTRKEFDERQALVQDLSDHSGKIGNPKTNVWRGVQVEAVLPSDLTRIESLVTELQSEFATLQVARDVISRSLTIDCQSLREVVNVANIIRVIRKIPDATDFSALENPVWKSMRSSIATLVNQGSRFKELDGFIRSKIREDSFNESWGPIYSELYNRSKSPFRFFHFSYLVSCWKMNRALLNKKTSMEEKISIAGCVDEWHQCKRKIEQLSAIGSQAFGFNWFGEESNWELLKGLADWVESAQSAGMSASYLSILEQVSSDQAIGNALEQIRSAVKPVSEKLKLLSEVLNLSSTDAFGCASLHDVPIEILSERTSGWCANLARLRDWIQFSNRIVRLRRSGMHWLADRVFEGSMNSENLVASFQFKYFEDLLRLAYEAHPVLRDFSGISHNELIEEFRSLDEARLQFTRQEVAASHYQQIPRFQTSAGELNIIKKEINKKRNHMPVRKLISKAGRAIQLIKPVFMMSPISVAQFLEPGGLEFDLLLVDEASQVKPVDALGAVARCKQIVVVGDSKQLPPTNFFDKMVDADRDEAEESLPSDVESILGLCVAEGMSQRMLKWHYRSRHQSLIAVSNHEFYNNDLFVVPSPYESNQKIGLSFEFVSDGVFDRGKSRVNKPEAKRIAREIINHARKHPDKSLGVGAFSVSQRDEILDQLELLRHGNANVEEFFVRGGAEPFFVKNLENIQGDERDVIFISVGYGKDSSGYLSMSFGPLNNEGGERRLNVLISRAKEKCIVFSSIVADDIDLNRTKSRGVKALKTFLSYAKTGILDVAEVTGEGCDSEFERQVAVALLDLGYQVKTQVGVAGFKIDLAIVDEEQPGRYQLGIECDGAQYHSSRSARDRDRLRQAVLEDRGWKVHRVWSTDWFHDPERELRKVVAAMDQTHEEDEDPERVEGQPVTHELTVDSEPPEVLRQEESDEPGPQPEFVVPYLLANVGVGNMRELHEVGAVLLSQVINRVVEIESPIHQDELARRISGFFGLARTGKRAAAAIEDALDYGIHRLGLQKKGDFIFSPTEAKPVVRDRSAPDVERMRKVELIAPAEFRVAVLGAVGIHIGIEPSELTKMVAGYLGFQSVSKKLREKVESELETLINEDLIEVRQQRLYVTSQAIVESNN